MKNKLTKTEMRCELLADAATRMSRDDYEAFAEYLMKLRERSLVKLYNSIFN